MGRADDGHRTAYLARIPSKSARNGVQRGARRMREVRAYARVCAWNMLSSNARVSVLCIRVVESGALLRALLTNIHAQYIAYSIRAP